MYILSEIRVVPLRKRYGINSDYRMVRELCRPAPVLSGEAVDGMPS